MFQTAQSQGDHLDSFSTKVNPKGSGYFGKPGADNLSVGKDDRYTREIIEGVYTRDCGKD